jgi:predicted SAM-dependent methyltransferase
VTTGTLADAALPEASVDVATLWHVIEHLDSPRAALEEVREVLAPGGLLAIETPAADTVWLRLLRGRWRQLIPDHYFFFTRATLARLLEATGFEVVELRKVGKPVSGRFLADRLRRVHPTLGAVGKRAVALARAEERTVRINPGDIMLAVARRPT